MQLDDTCDAQSTKKHMFGKTWNYVKNAQNKVRRLYWLSWSWLLERDIAVEFFKFVVLGVLRHQPVAILFHCIRGKATEELQLRGQYVFWIRGEMSLFFYVHIKKIKNQDGDSIIHISYSSHGDNSLVRIFLFQILYLDSVWLTFTERNQPHQKQERWIEKQIKQSDFDCIVVW